MQIDISIYCDQHVDYIRPLVEIILLVFS